MASGTELAKAYVQIVPSAKGMGSSITNMLNGEAGTAGDNAGNTLGSRLVSSIKKLVAAAGIGAFVKEALEAGGALQQSFGGLETLYGEASTSMKQYAQDAAAVGISANSYAEQATSFGASLKQAFGGDVTQAAEAANQAIIDMADNSSKFGTDIESIQNAYQGFSKQNYTMLDNLKLGYGGTKSEMERLLADAEELSGQTYSIDNLGDVYEAIHVIQEDLGVTGNAAAEASQTFTGSFDAMKASAENLLAALSSGEMDVGPQMQSLVSSASSFLFGNLIPMVINIGTQLPEALGAGLQTALPILQEQATSLLDNVMSFLTEGGAEQMISSGVGMITNLGTGFIESLPALIENAGTIVSGLLNGILQNLPTLLTGAYQMVSTLVQGIISNLPQIAASAGQLIAKLAQSILQNLPQILTTGIQIITKLVIGIIQAIPRIPAAAKQVISSFKNSFSGIDWGTLGKNIIQGIARGITGSATAIASAAKQAAQSALTAAKNLLGIHSPSRVFRDEVGKMISLGMAEGISGNGAAVLNAVSEVSDGALNAAQLNTLTTGRNNQSTYANTVNGKVIELLQIIADKDFSVGIGNRDFKRSLEDVGVQFKGATA